MAYSIMNIVRLIPFVYRYYVLLRIVKKALRALGCKSPS